jgi:hypothetical protein
MTEYILCAAIWFNDGKEYVHQPKNIKTGFVVCGRRHHNCFAIYAAMKSLRGTKDADIDNFPKAAEQGFLTSTDRFVDREEAAEIAWRQKQIERRPKRLFSEDLY